MMGRSYSLSPCLEIWRPDENLSAISPLDMIDNGQIMTWQLAVTTETTAKIYCSQKRIHRRLLSVIISIICIY
ncbi:hypothetical protein XENTR_v10004839 [Xenopus tropicalis]|nr:hypothetical protein XENTR_v10004839 [Xenopus tropicalis]